MYSWCFQWGPGPVKSRVSPPEAGDAGHDPSPLACLGRTIGYGHQRLHGSALRVDLKMSCLVSIQNVKKTVQFYDWCDSTWALYVPCLSVIFIFIFFYVRFSLLFLSPPQIGAWIHIYRWGLQAKLNSLGVATRFFSEVTQDNINTCSTTCHLLQDKLFVFSLHWGFLFNNNHGACGHIEPFGVDCACDPTAEMVRSWKGMQRTRPILICNRKPIWWFSF